MFCCPLFIDSLKHPGIVSVGDQETVVIIQVIAMCTTITALTELFQMVNDDLQGFARSNGALECETQ